MRIDIAARFDGRWLPSSESQQLAFVRDVGHELRVVVADGSETGWDGFHLPVSRWVGERLMSVVAPPDGWLRAVADELFRCLADFSSEFACADDIDGLTSPSCSLMCVSVRQGQVDAAWLGALRVVHVHGARFVDTSKPQTLVQQLIDTGQLVAGEGDGLRDSDITLGAFGKAFAPDQIARLPQPWRPGRGDAVIVTTEASSPFFAYSTARGAPCAETKAAAVIEAMGARFGAAVCLEFD